MRKENINFLNHEIIYVGNDNPTFLIIYLEENIDLAYIEKFYLDLENKEIALLAIKINNWNDELSPWFDKAVYGNNDFNGEGNETLLFIDELIKEYKKEYPNTKFIISGYSLAGLFALYASYNLDYFDGVVASSPSVWFKDWDKYIENNEIKTNRIYLSLGDKEKNSKNNRMAKVEERIELQKEILLKNNKDVYLEYNPGGHFNEPQKRMIKGIKYLINDN